MTKKSKQPPMSEQQVITALKRLEQRWPKNLWIFAAAGSFTLMRTGDDGERRMAPHNLISPGYDSALQAKTFKIPCDGGDW